jgi:hypothetical protein
LAEVSILRTRRQGTDFHGFASTRKKMFSFQLAVDRFFFLIPRFTKPLPDRNEVLWLLEPTLLKSPYQRGILTANNLIYSEAGN